MSDTNPVKNAPLAGGTLPRMSLMAALQARAKTAFTGDNKTSSTPPGRSQATSLPMGTVSSTPPFRGSLSELLLKRTKRPHETASLASSQSIDELSAGPKQTAPSSGASTVEDLERKMSRLRSPMRGDVMDVEPGLTAGGTREQEQAASEAHNPSLPLKLAFGTSPLHQYPTAQMKKLQSLVPIANPAIQASSALASSALVPLPVRRTDSVTATPADTKMVLARAPGRVHLRHHQDGLGMYITAAEFKRTKLEQRGGQHLFDTKWAYPLGVSEPMERASLIRCTEFICKGIFGCEAGDCLHQFTTSDVSEARRKAQARLDVMKASRSVPLADVNLSNLFHFDLLQKWNGTSFEDVSYPVTDYLNFQLCPSSYALLLGVVGTSARTVLQRIRDGVPLNWPGVADGTGTGVLLTSGAEQKRRESLERTMLEQYVSTELMGSHENNPAPGAHKEVETTLNASTWKHKWQMCLDFFEKTRGEEVGSMKIFQEVFRKEKRLKEKRAMSHSKCDICKKIDVDIAKFVGDNRPWAREQVSRLRRAKREHEGKHLKARSVLDQHGFMAFTNPENVWCIACDAATARNMELPRHNGVRMAKSAAGTMPKFKLKLTAVYAYGYGFIPFLSHESLRHGPNLVWTVIWQSICQLKKHYGRYPDVLFLVLDNTTGENKTEVMLAVASWLVATKRVKQVRVFFLMVGHTHIIIDQIFGVITVNLRGKPILLPERLITLIDQAVAKNPQYQGHPVQWLHSLFDFWKFSKAMKVHSCEGLFKRTQITDEHGKYNGMSDYTFKHDSEHLALMQYREQHDFPWRPEGSGVPIIRELPTQPPPLVQTDPYEKWGKIKALTLENTVHTFLSFASLTHTEERGMRERWSEHIADIPTVTELLKPEFKLVFQDFHYDPHVPRIACRGAPPEQEDGGTGTGTGTPDKELEYSFWLQTTFAGHRTVPFAYDPVTSKEQTASEYKKARQHYEHSYMATLEAGTGPTTSRQSLVLGGAFLFGLLKGSVSLFKIEDIGKMQTPRSIDPRMSCSIYEHTPQPGVSGFFGTFRSAKAGTGKVILERDDVLVYNVSFRDKMVSLASLRVLAVAKPVEYPVPDKVPESHLTGLSGDGNDSSEDEELGQFNFDMPSEKSATKKAGQRGSKRKKKQARKPKPNSSSTDADGIPVPVPPKPPRPRRSGASGKQYAGHDSCSESDSSSNSESPQASSSDEEADGPAMNDAPADNEEEAVPDSVPEAVPQQNPDTLELCAPTNWCPDAGTLAFVQCVSNQENPISLVWVESISDDIVTVYWFGDVDLSDKHLNTARKITFQKHWKTRDTVLLEIALGLRNKNRSKKKKRAEPSKDLVAEHWSNDTYETSAGVFVPILVPSPPSDRVWKCDATVTLHDDFLRNKLLPALQKLRGD